MIKFWVTIIENCTENGQWPAVIFGSVLHNLGWPENNVNIFMLLLCSATHETVKYLQLEIGIQKYKVT